MSPTCEWLWSLTQRTFSPLEPWEQACWILRVADQESLTALTTSPNRVRPPTFSSPRTPTPGDRSLMNLIIFNRLGANWGGETDKEDGDDSSGQERLDKLASFQLMMIRHAMKCEHCGPPLFSSLSISKTPLPVCSDVFPSMTYGRRSWCGPPYQRRRRQECHFHPMFQSIAQPSPAPILRFGSPLLPFSRVYPSNFQKLLVHQSVNIRDL